MTAQFFKLWFFRSIPLVAVHYVLIILIWGHDPAPVTQALVLPAIWGSPEPAWLDLHMEIPKLYEVFIGPLLLLWYMLNQRHLQINKQFIQASLLIVGSTILMFQSLSIGIICFIATGSLIAKKVELSAGVIQVAFYGYSTFLVMWALPAISFGFLGWSFTVLALFMGFLCGLIVKRHKALKR